MPTLSRESGRALRGTDQAPHEGRREFLTQTWFAIRPCVSARVHRGIQDDATQRRRRRTRRSHGFFQQTNHVVTGSPLGAVSNDDAWKDETSFCEVLYGCDIHSVSFTKLVLRHRTQIHDRHCTKNHEMRDWNPVAAATPVPSLHLVGKIGKESLIETESGRASSSCVRILSAHSRSLFSLSYTVSSADTHTSVLNN
mgnify:CR=1 FL=1